MVGIAGTPVLLGTHGVAANEIQAIVPISLPQTFWLCRRQAGKLQKAWAHLASGTRVGLRYRIDQVTLKPRERVARGQTSECSRAAACIDRAAHQDEAPGRRLTRARQQGNRSQRWHGGLTDGQHM
ncbi:hypothetical protein D3C72_2041700 [compost metagenome]